MASGYEDPGPDRTAVETWIGPAVLEFGADWCPICQGAASLIAEAVGGVRHVKVADGKGKPLGRSFAVKLWPTIVFLKDGVEAARVVRPTDADEVRRGLAAITAG